MMHGVIADLVAFVMNAAHQVRVQVGPVTGDEESRVDVVQRQDIQDVRGWL